MLIIFLKNLLFLAGFFYVCAMTTYTISEYIQSRSSIANRINAIEMLIDQMYAEMGEAIGNVGVAEYQLDDGQMKIRTNYRSVDQIAKGIDALETQLQMYINRYNGRATILRGRINY